MKDRRLAVFSIHQGIIDSHPEAVKQLMAKVIVLRAETRIEDEAIRYVAQCDDFPKSPAGDILVEYRPIFFLNADGTAEFRGWNA